MYSLDCFGNTAPPRFTFKKLHSALFGAIKTKVLLNLTVLDQNINPYFDSRSYKTSTLALSMYSLDYFGNTPPPRFANKRFDSNLPLSKVGLIRCDWNGKFLLNSTVLDKNINLIFTTDLTELQLWHFKCILWTVLVRRHNLDLLIKGLIQIYFSLK